MSKDWRRGGGVLVNVNLANHKGQFAYFLKDDNNRPFTFRIDRPLSPLDHRVSRCQPIKQWVCAYQNMSTERH